MPCGTHRARRLLASGLFDRVGLDERLGRDSRFDVDADAGRVPLLGGAGASDGAALLFVFVMARWASLVCGDIEPGCRSKQRVGRSAASDLGQRSTVPFTLPYP